MNLMSNLRTLGSTLAKEYAPDFVAGALEAEAKSKTAAQFYDYIHRGIWNSLPPGQRQFLINQKPWELNWLTLDFIVNAISQSNEKIAAMVITSPQLQGKIQDEIEEIKHQLS